MALVSTSLGGGYLLRLEDQRAAEGLAPLADEQYGSGAQGHVADDELPARTEEALRQQRVRLRPHEHLASKKQKNRASCVFLSNLSSSLPGRWWSAAPPATGWRSSAPLPARPTRPTGRPKAPRGPTALPASSSCKPQARLYLHRVLKLRSRPENRSIKSYHRARLYLHQVLKVRSGQ